MAQVETPNVSKAPSKSKLIVGAFKTAGMDAPASDIADAVRRDHNVEVTDSLINNVRFRVNKKKAERGAAISAGRKRRPRLSPPVTASPGSPVPAMTGDNTFNRYKAVKDFAGTLGGLAGLKALVGEMEALGVS